MSVINPFLNRVVTAFLFLAVISLVSVHPVAAQTRDLDALFAELADPENEDWEDTEDEIRRIFADSGSESMNMLLERGHRSLELGDYLVAIDHFTALTDHSPDFAEGYNARATAYYLIGMFGPSMEDISRVLTLEPRHFDAMVGMARILEESGKPKQALEVFEQVAILHPHEPNVADDIARLNALVGGTNL
ncbi:tetratricopeptide repeat protein [Falsihalocynthiibacter sp. SS001]|uniref:tetratricopeptide repeat protein n=1 Tax=Falsihalocynthiibacter sp. SS001 TaxID=3349698 RepID=UPI0036D31123